MARLRFPGRPGHRFDRLSLKYFADDIKNSQDPSLAFLPQFQRGLRSFRDIVGLSDEDDEFEGFTFEELEDGEKKLSVFNKEQQKKEKAEQSAETEGAAMYRGTRLGNARQSLESLPATERTRVKIKTVVGKSYKDLLKDENKRPGKAEIQPVKIKGTKIFDHRKKPKKFKLDYKHGLHDIHASESKAKKSDMDMAKFLLEKAKQANKIQEQARARRLAAAKKPVQVQRKEFVLPTQSSRSSRVIKPNKRFLESDSVNTIVIKKSKPDEMVETTPEKLHGKSISERKKSLDSFRPSFSGSPNSIGLLDQPLIVDGKRDRKPSLKLQMSDDESPLFSPTKSAMTSPLAAPKLGTSLFSQSQFQKASEKQKFSMMGFGASRLHGTSIVQKAKLQLNRAALNKSKAALARSLKAEMNREAKYAEQVKQYEVDTSQMVTADQPPKEKGSEKKRLKRKSCAVCGKKTDLVVCYDKIVVCLSCRRFYKECNWLINAGTFTRPHCTQNDKCKLKPDKIKCRLCRIRKVLQVGFPPLPQLTELFKDENGVEKTGTVEEPAEVEILASPAGKKGVRKGTPIQSPVPVVVTPSLTTPPPVLVTSEDTTSKEQELSPLKAGEGSEKRQRKKRAFKELLRNKQEKVEETEPVHQEKPAIQEPPPVVATGSVEISPRGGPGPRIKHVCRNAAVVLGQPLATFPEKSELRLSALPTKDKVQLWKKDEESKAANEDSDDDRPMEEIIQQSGDSVVIVKKSPTKTKVSRKLTGAGGLHIYKRRMRCRQCPGCVRQDCGVCRHCLDKPKFGGAGVLKQGCVERRCSNPLIQRSATEAFIVEKKKNTAEPRANSKQVVPERTRDRPEGDLTEGHSEFTPSDGLEPVIPGSGVTQTVSGLQIQTGTLLQDETQSNNNVAEKLNENIPSVSKDKYSLETRQQTAARGQGSSARGQGSEVRKLTFEDLPNFQLERISSRNKESGKISSKLMKKLEMQQKYSKKEGGNDGQCYPVTLQSVLPASRQWGSLLSQPRYYPIKVDFKGKCDLGSAWNYGMALMMSNAMSVRTLCFLCGSAGKHELIYCNICCEPFHEFCLEDWEQPSPDHYDDWICAACQFCHVCGRQNNLLQCDKCQNTYHPGCLGPNYPTKPSKRKNIWICTKCVKCKSCGATTPGSDSQATWTYDFSLCFECGRLMDKGNFCPICRKCYSDDDWESKMIQCNMCESWVHSKCEGLTDEMYEILSYLPEDLSFYCRKCFPVGCPEWESTLKRELRLGLENILQSLILSKSSQYILKQEKKSPPKQTVLPSHQAPEKQNNSCTLTNKNGSFTLMNKNNVEATQDRVKRNLKSFEKIKQLLKGGACRELTDRTKEGIGSGDAKLDIPNEGSNGTCLEITSKVEQSLHGIKACDSISEDTSVAMETDNCSGDNALSQTSSNVTDGERKVTENLENAQNVILTVNTEKIKHSCDKVRESSSESSPYSGSCGFGPETGRCEGGNVVENKPMICDKQTVCDLNVVQGSKGESTPETINSNNDNKDVQNTEKCDPTSSEQSCPTGNNSAENSEINNSETVLDEVKTESIKVSEGNVIHSVSVDKHPSVTSQDLTADKNAQDRIVDSTCIKEVLDNKSECNGAAGVGSGEVVSRRSHRVQFNVVENKDTRATEQVQETENDYPKDLMEVTQKMKTGDYKSVAIFCEDILRVIQTYLDNEEEARTSRKKATQSAKSIFVKQLEKIFPWFNVKTCRHWYSMRSLPDGMLPDATLPPNTDHTYAQWLERVETPRSPQPSPFKRRTATPVKKYIPIDEEDYELGQLFEGDDERKCMFCHIFGDQESNDAGRLLYCGQDDWCHVNCALWSAEVYEDADGELQNLVEAFSRAKMLRCDLCGKSGATVGCNTKGCKANYHFMCARRDQCRFQEDKKVFCKMHRMYIDAELLRGDRFNVLRRAYVGTLYVRSVKKRWSKGLHCGDVSVLMGSCCVEGLGRLTDLSDKPKFLQPVDFITTRMYWSTKDARRRCVYTCRIVEVRPEMLKSPTITIKDMRIVHDQDHPDYVPISNLDITGINSVSEQQQLSVCGTDSENPFIDLTTDTADLTANTADLTANTADLTANTADLTGNSADLTTNQSANNCNLSETLSAEEHTMDIVCDKSQLSGLSLNRQTDIGNCKTVEASSHRRASFSGLPSERNVYKDSDKLSMSWPCSNAKPASEKPIQTNLSFLSPNTLKMLNIKDPSKFVKPVESTEKDQEEFSLLKVADRLNRAAAKCSRQKSEERSSPLLNRSEGNSPLPFRAHSRSPSVERVGSPMLTRPFSPIVGIRQRSQSGDRNTEIKPFQPSFSLQNKFSSLLASLPEKSFTPPARMLARSKSLSIEREFLSSKFSNNTSVTGKNEPFLPPVQSDSPTCLRRGRSVSDPVDIMPKPVSFSSPVASKADLVEPKKFVLSDISTDNEESENFNPSSHNSTKSFGTESQDMETETDLNECSEITEAENRSSEITTESECTDSSQNNGTVDEATETIIVMTESGESLSEEDAIKIVQDMIEQRNSSLETEDQDQSVEIEEDKETNTDNNLESNSGAGSEDGAKDECVDTEIQNNEHPDSPFIPQIENESIGNERVIRNTGDKRAGETVDNSDTTENEETSNESQVDSNDVLDKDDNATEDTSLDSKKNEEVDMILIDTCSDTDSDNDIIDITDSVVNAGTVNQESESDKNEIPEVQSETNLSNAIVEDDAMKRIVYDLDESIDSDIEVLDDLNMMDKEESNSQTSCENINANEGKSADEIKDSETSDSAPIECSNNVIQTDSTCEDGVLVNAPLNNKTCLNEDEIDGDTAKTTSQIKEKIKQMIDTRSGKLESENVEDENEISVSSNEKAATCISQSSKYALEMEDSKVGLSEEAIVDNAVVDGKLTEDHAFVDGKLTEDNALVDGKLTEDNALVDGKLTEDNALVDGKLTEDNALVGEELTEDNALVGEELTEDNALVDVELTEDNALVDKDLTEDNALVDVELTEDNALVDKELTEMKNCDENLDSSKEEVLRGLGLGTLDEVERLKNSPQKSPCFPVLTPEVKKKCSKKLPVKSYPLRNNMSSPARLRDDDVAKVKSRNEKKNSVNEFEDPFKDMNEKRSTERGTVNDMKELDQEIYKELSPELPVLDPIAKKIKEESIAKSCPEEKGPFKCSKCRRQYRTETSYLVHAENCNFLVSSSDDEDTNQDDEDSKVKTKSKELRSTRSKTKSLIEEKVQKKESICSSDDNTDNKRTTLRRSTQYQRVAIEVEKRQQEEENPKRGRGRPPFKSRDSLESDKDKHQKELMSKETFASKTGDPHSSENLDNVKKVRGRPRKSEIMYKSMEGESENIELIEEKVSVRETRRKSREAKILENLSQSSDSEIEERHDKNAVVVKLKRGRPKKINTSSGEVKHDSSEEEPPVAKQKLRKDDMDIEKHSTKENCHDMKDSCSNFKQVKADLKSQIENIRTSRYRPAKMVHMKTRNKTIRIYVKDSKKLRDRNNRFGLKAVSVRLQKTDYLHKSKDLIKADRMSNNVGKSTSNNTDSLNEKNCLTETPKPRGRGRPPLRRKVSVEDEHDVEKLEGCDKLNVSHNEEIAEGKRMESQSVKSKTLKESKIDESSGEDESSSCKQDQNIEREEDMSVNIEDDLENDIDMDVHQNQESSDEEDSILDESTGWIVDKKSGEMIRSPTQKKPNDDHVESENSKDEKDIEDETLDEINNTNTEQQNSSKEKCHTVGTSNVVEHGAEHKKDNLNVNKESVLNVNAEGGKDDENKDTTRFNSPQLEENMFDENKCVTEMEVEKITGNSTNENREKLVENSSENSTLELQKPVDAEVKKGTDTPNAAEVKALSEQGAIQSMEFKDATDNLPNTVLKLLKDGHKVVIRNPKLNKCFMWQKTADGYIGKPFDKKLAKSPSVSEKNEASRQNSSETDSSGSNCISENTTDSQGSNARLKTASDILRERKKSDVEQTPLKQGLDTSVGQCIEKLTEKPEILKRKAKFVVENIERLIETNKKAKARALVPERLPRGSAEYVGGILISPPKSVSVDEVKHTIKSTAPIATNMLQNTLLQNKLINNYQGGVQNFSSSAVQSALQSPVSIATQSGYPALQQQLQTGSMRMFTQSDLQTVTQTALQPYPQVTPQNIVPAGYSNISMNSLQSLSPVSPQYTSQVVPSPVIQQTYRPSQVVPSSVIPQTYRPSQVVPSPVIQQTYQPSQVVPSPVIQQTYQPVQVQQVQQIPSLEMGVINVPLITSVGFSNAQLVQTMGTINPNASHPFLNTNSQSYVNTPSSTSLIVNSQISQPLINAHTTQTLLNQYMTQTLLSPQASQTMGNQFVSQPQTVVNQLSSRPRTINQFSAQPQTIINQLSPQPQTSVVNQLGSQQQIAQSSFNQEQTQPQVSKAVVSQQSTPQCSFAQPRPIYNQTQIVNRTSGTKVSYQTNVPKTVLDIDQTVIDRQTVYSVLKRKLSSHPEVKDSDSDTKNSAPYFKVFPGLGGGTNSLIKKMHTYISSKHKLPPSLTTSPTHKRIKPYSAATGDSNGMIQTKQPTSVDPKVVYISPKKQKVKKHLSRKSKLKREMSPRKWTRPYRKRNPTPKVASGIAVPHKTDKASHPMIHGPKEVTSLPVAAVEEEVRDVPLSTLDDNDSRQSGIDGTGQNRGHLEYEIFSDDGFSCRSDTLEGAWKQVTEKVQDARTASRLKHLSYAGLSGLQMFGLSHPSVVYLVEQLYGASYCRRYKFKYHRHEMVERELELVNPTGCIRTEPFSGRNPSDMFSFLMSRYRTLPEYCDRYVNEEIAMKSSRRATSMDLPMAMRFRKLKGFSKECVGVYRSTIHGRGLFCKRSIDAGEMIIEYAGEVIRNSMTDIREKYYESKGIGCYMFRIDDTDVVDATMRGSAARFINHSCDPNCYSKVITVDNRKHIVIFAMRKILRGEELTYDYKFPIEEIKIPCTCGAKKCRRYLN